MDQWPIVPSIHSRPIMGRLSMLFDFAQTMLFVAAIVSVDAAVGKVTCCLPAAKSSSFRMSGITPGLQASDVY